MRDPQVILQHAFKTETFRKELYSDKYQLSLTTPLDTLHHGKRAANKGGRSV